jgi:hypothetical protein
VYPLLRAKGRRERTLAGLAKFVRLVCGGGRHGGPAQGLPVFPAFVKWGGIVAVGSTDLYGGHKS